MRKTELIVSGEVICPKTKASIVAHEHTNVETLLDQQNRTSSTITQSASTSKVGLGDGEDLSFCVEDGFYESATLYGKTMVNCIQEPSSEDVVLPYEFEEGRYVTINDTKESGALGVELKGQTLVNLLNFNKIIANAITHSKDGDKITVSSISERAWASLDIFIESLKPNTDYILMIDNVSFTHADNFGATVAVYCRDGNVKLGQLPSQSSNFFKFNTADKDLSLITLRIHATLGSANSATTVVNGLRVLEYQQGMENWDIPYFEGMTSCKMPILSAVGKNLFNINNPSYTWESDGNLISTIEENKIKLLGYFSNFKEPYRYEFALKENTSYVFSYETFGNLGYEYPEDFCLRIYKDDTLSRTLWRMRGKVGFTLSNGENKVRFDIRLNKEWGEGEIYEIDGGVQNIQLEESSIKTSYEPYKSSILSLPEEVVLRSLPNGVCDTFNTRTGEYVQRIGEQILDGSNDEQWSKDTWWTKDETVGFEMPLTISSVSAWCNKLYVNMNFNNFIETDKEQLSLSQQWQVLGIRVLSTKLASQDVDGLRTYLQSNPITVQHELAEPIVTKINLPSTLKSWNTTTHIYSEIPENSLYPILSHSNPTYPVILKPSTKYSIVANSHSNGHANSAINFNLGGATASTTVGNRVTTITTPSTLSNELLTMSGRGNKLNNVMVIEGDVVGDEPYFEGICDSKSPTLSNVGKNLFDVNQTPSYVTKNTTYSIANNEVTINSTGETNYPRIIYTLDKKLLGKTIFVSYDVVKNTSNNWILQFVYTKIDGTRDYKNCRVGIPITLPNEITGDLTIGIYADNTSATGTAHTLILKNIQIEEGSVATPYEPYKSNILSCNGDKIELTKDMLEQGGFSAGSMVLPTYEQCKTSTNSTIRMRSKELIKVSPNTTYIVTNKTLNLNYTTYTFDSNRHFTGETSTTNASSFTTSPSCQYIAIMFSKGNNSTVVTSDFKESEFQIYEVDKTIVLRSLPNGVCDTLNVETGEYVQRIGEIDVLNTIANWVHADNVGIQDTNTLFRIAPNPSTTGVARDNVLSNKFPTKFVMPSSNNDEEVVFGEANGGNSIYISIRKSRLQEESIEGFKQWLIENPTIIQYELKTPIIKTVDLSGYPFAYENGHVILSSGSIEQSLTPKVEYVVQTNRAGAIQANQDRLLNHDKRLAMLEDLVLHQLIQLEYSRAKCTFLSQTRQIFEGGIQMYHTKYELLSEFIEKKLYRSLEEVFEMLDVYFMLGDITDGEYDALYEALMPSAEEIFEVEETFDHEDVEV